MAPLTNFQLNDGSDTAEVERGVRLCLRAEWTISLLDKAQSDWEGWVKRGDWKVLAGHVARVYGLAQRQALNEIISADAALKVGLLAEFPADKPLPAAPDPLIKGVVRSISQGKMPGHAATLCAVGAASFHLPLLVALQSAFFLEWQVRQVKRNSASIALFIRSCHDFLSQLPPFLSNHESAVPSRFSAR